MKKLSLDYRLRRPKPAQNGTKQLAKPPMIVLLHGGGGHEDDIFNEFTEVADDRLMVLSVRAPFAQSPKSNAWFRISPFMSDHSVNTDDAELSRQRLVQFIQEAVVELDADPAQVYLLGFEQGATLSLSLTLTEPGLLAGTIVMSGIILSEIFHIMVGTTQLQDYPIFLSYGLHDQVLHVTEGRKTRDILDQFGMNIFYREYGSGHYLSPSSLRDANNWLSDLLNKKKNTWQAAISSIKARLGYVQLRVRDIDRSIIFYKRFLGFRLVERVGKAYAFLSGGYQHHELALQNVGSDALDISSYSVGLAHIAFEAEDLSSFGKIYLDLINTGIRVRTMDHMISWSLYFLDPDGNEVCVYCDTRDMPGKSDLWQGRDLPLDETKIMAFLETNRSEGNSAES